ncbi:uncharacterized protein TNCV_3767781 [Trichonephila clavipes]|nr:uncharacterized protein TNCV_3767781 [Trichonephila clavipes]
MLLEQIYCDSGHVGCRNVLLKFPQSVGMNNGNEWVQVIIQDACVPVTCQSRIWTYQGSHFTPTAHTPYHHRASNRLKSPLLTRRVNGFMRLYPYLYTSISSIQLETRLVIPGIMFLVIKIPMSVLTGPGEA